MMSDWKECTIGEIASVKGGKRLPKGVNLITEQNAHPYIRIRDLTEKTLELKSSYEYVDNETQKCISRYIVGTGDILISIVGTIGLVAVVGESLNGANLTENCVKLIDIREDVDREYLYYFLVSNMGQDEIKKGTVGAVQPKLPIKNIQSIKLYLPHIDIQKRISGLLSAIDCKIAQNTAINENLEQQAQALFKAWFVDFEPFGGVMPDDWSECILDSMCSLIIKGITPKYIEHSAQFVINQKCVRNHQIDLSLARCHEPKKVNEKWLQYGDIVVNSTGTGTLGRAAQVLFTPNNMTVDSHVTIIRASKQEYIYYLGLWATSHEHDFEMLQTGSTGQTDLPRERLKQMPVILPSDDILCKFSEIIKPIADIRIKNQQENQSLAALRDTLLPKLMNGEIDVSAVRI